MSKLVIVVPHSRAYCGRAILIGADGNARLGPLRVLATASLRVARKHGNETCDPLRPFGHPPAGEYAVASSLPPGYQHPRRPRRYGNVGALLLAPRGGDALASLANGRHVFALHGGPLDPASRLRPTRGGVRMSDVDMSALMSAVNDANANDDPLESIELLEVSDADVRSVPAVDLRGARQTIRAKGRRGEGPISQRMAFALFGLGATKGAGDVAVDRRELLKNAVLLVGGLTAAACSSQASPCIPLACDPSDGKLIRDGGGEGRRTVDCPPSGFVCEEDYVVAGGYG